MTAVSAFASCQPSVDDQRPVDGLKYCISAVTAAAAGVAACTVERNHGVQAISDRLPALPQARTAPTPWADGLSMLYFSARQPVSPLGMVVSPSLEPLAQVWPPSKERSSQTSSVGEPSSMLPPAMSSPSEMCSVMTRLHTVAVAGFRSPVASAGSRPSQ